MLHRLQSFFTLTLLLAFSLVVTGCGSDGSASWLVGGDGGGVETSSAQISSVYNMDLPGQPIRVGDWIQVTGSGFGSARLGTTSEGYVAFSDGTMVTKAASYGTWSDTLVECQVPQGAPIKSFMIRGSITIGVVPADFSGGASFSTNANPTPNPSPEPTPPSPTPSPSPSPTVFPTPTPSPSVSPTPSPSPTSGGGGGGGPAPSPSTSPSSSPTPTITGFVYQNPRPTGGQSLYGIHSDGVNVFVAGNKAGYMSVVYKYEIATGSCTLFTTALQEAGAGTNQLYAVWGKGAKWYVAGDYYAAYTTDTGATWTKISNLPTSYWKDIYGDDNGQNVVLVGGYGTTPYIYYSAAGDGTFVQQNSPVTGILYSTWVNDDGSLILIGGGAQSDVPAKLLRTTDKFGTLTQQTIALGGDGYGSGDAGDDLIEKVGIQDIHGIKAPDNSYDVVCAGWDNDNTRGWTATSTDAKLASGQSWIQGTVNNQPKIKYTGCHMIDLNHIALTGSPQEDPYVYLVWMTSNSSFLDQSARFAIGGSGALYGVTSYARGTTCLWNFTYSEGFVVTATREGGDSDLSKAVYSAPIGNGTASDYLKASALSGISAFNNSNVIAVGESKTYVTTDGGSTWNYNPAGISLNQVWMDSATTAFAVGTVPLADATSPFWEYGHAAPGAWSSCTDGLAKGVRWTDLKAAGASAIYAAGYDSTTGRGYINRYNGSAWEGNLTDSGWDEIQSVYVESATRAIAVAANSSTSRGSILTYEGGAWDASSWTKTSPSTVTDLLTGISGASDTCIIVGQDSVHAGRGVAYVSTDGGATWTRMLKDKDGSWLKRFGSVVVKAPDYAIATGSSGYIYLYNGTDWQKFIFTSYFGCLAVPSPGTVFSLGDTECIIKSK